MDRTPSMIKNAWLFLRRLSKLPYAGKRSVVNFRRADFAPVSVVMEVLCAAIVQFNHTKKLFLVWGLVHKVLFLFS